MAPDTDRPRRALIAGAISTGLALSLLFACAGTARALVDDRFTTRTQPASSLVMPFDQRSGHASFLIASSLAGAAAVSTHWSFWNEDCSNLGEVSICLTPNDTVVVDPGAVRSLDAANKSIDEPLDLAGKRGFATVTAYETDASCADGAAKGSRLVERALVGTATIADLATEASYGFDAIGLFAAFDGSFVNLPDLLLSPDAASGALAIQTHAPSRTTDSLVVLLALGERGGLWPGEVGPGRHDGHGRTQLVHPDPRVNGNRRRLCRVPGRGDGC